jgi:U32 family peptidase
MSSAVLDSAASLSARTTLRPEVLAPAGDWDCLKAAIENGADAVYFGLQGHNARARAVNFQADELESIFGLLHRRGVKGYVAVNTLVFPDELAGLERLLRRIALAGADGIIVQDIAVVRMARALCPDLPIHASTQMTLTSAESIRVLEDLGVERVVAARELSIAELRLIRRATRMPLEVFVHGALCVAYSGQCLTSEALGGRSANRGQCAQACRLPYEVICDERPVDLADVQYLLSPQDLAAYALIPDLVAMGVAGLKIEGRLKTAEYVANITRHYRMAVDAALAGQPVAFTPRQVEEMEMSFSRGFSPGWLQGNDHKRLVQGRCPRKRGLFLGEVQSIHHGRVTVKLSGPLKRGDGVVFDRGRPEEDEQGGRVYEIFVNGRSLTDSVSTGPVELAFGRDAIDLTQVQPGDRLWKTDDPELNRRLRQSFTGADPVRRVPLDMTVLAEPGKPLSVSCRAENGAEATVESAAALAVAVRHPLTEAVLREQLGRLGGSVYVLRSLNAHIDGGPMAPLSVLGQVRKELIAALDRSFDARPRRTMADESIVGALRASIEVVDGNVGGVSRRRSSNAIHPEPGSASGDASYNPPRLHVLCRNLEQLHSAAAAGLRLLYTDFQDIREYGAAVAAGHAAGAEVYLATPRIQKPKEGPLFRYLLRSRPDGILVRNLGALAFFARRGVPIVADFSLNAANELTAQFYRERGAQRVTASYDLNREQLLDLVAAVPPGWLEVVVQQHMPMFHMEHCVFCAVLSPGTNRTNCGRPCDRHEVRLRDRVGMEHALKADVGCRNTLYNAVPQSAAEEVAALVARGVSDFRVELLNEDAGQAARVIGLYRDLLAGRVTGREVWTRLKASNKIGVTRGPLGT